MTDIQSRRARSLRGLQGIQRSAIEILEDSAHVALYRFLEEDQKWIRMDIEGSAFVTRNTEKPHYSFIILNKLGDKDLILQIEENIKKIKVQDKYLMMQCVSSDGKVIFGLWFHDAEERSRIYDKLFSLVNSRGKTHPALRKVDLSSILSSPTARPLPPSTSASSSSALLPPEEKEASITPGEKKTLLLSLLKSNPQPLLTCPSAPTPTKGATEKLKSLLLVPSIPPVSTAHGLGKGPETLSFKGERDEVREVSAALSPLEGKLLALIQKPAKKSGAELLTDGEIAKKLKDTPSQSNFTSPSPSAPIPAPSVPLSTSPLLLGRKEEEPRSAVKKTVKLISPSDLL